MQLSSVHGHEPSGACGVDRLACALQVQSKVTSIRQDCLVAAASSSVLCVGDSLPLGTTRADEASYVRRRSLERFEIVTGHIEALINNLQGFPLVGVHGDGLAVRDTEKLRIEELDAVNVALVPSVCLTRDHSSLHVISLAIKIYVPSGQGDLHEGIATCFCKHQPIAHVILGIRAEECRDASDCNTLAFRWRSALGVGS
mmetsp:Transcript_25920/g.68903  ORF Transcript_25920/g.68903 Transcript_25920/m.68903 type:complete len:200 (-) Transcript_25920:1065-1664(-)